MQDGAPVAGQKLRNGWICVLSTTLNGLQIVITFDYFKRPPSTYDLNANKYICAIIKRKLQEEGTSLLAKCRAALLKLWEELPRELKKTADAFRNRLQEVIRKKGNAIKYSFVYLYPSIFAYRLMAL